MNGGKLTQIAKGIDPILVVYSGTTIREAILGKFVLVH